MINIGYFGSPDFSAYFLEKILNDDELKKTIKIALVVTQPDRPVGRKQILTPTPVKQLAKKYHLEILEIKNLNSSSEFEKLKLKIKNLDLSLVYAFSQIIPKDLLNQPKFGFWNIHPSLLPHFRGPSPIAYALIFGEKETGVTIFQMDEKIDHGPIIVQKNLTIKNDDDRIDLEKKLTHLAFELFKQKIVRLKKSKNYQLKLTSQKHPFATYTRLLKKDDGFIPLLTLKKVLNNQLINFEELPLIVKEYLNKHPKEKAKFVKKFFKNKNLFLGSSFMFHFFRALSPWPGLWTILPNDKRLKIIAACLKKNEDVFYIKTVQLEGKKPVDFKTFNRAYKIF